jgi:hypothetical protein
VNEIWGRWWLPDHDERLSGRLAFDRVDGGELTLIGDFSDLPASAWSRPALFGESFDGEKLTLLKPFWRNRPPRISGLSLPVNRTLVGSLTLVRGAHVKSAEAFEIRRAVIRLQGLRALCLKPPIPLVGITQGFIGPAEEEAQNRTVEVDGGRLTFAYETFETRSRFGRTLEEDVEVRLELAEAVDLEEFEEAWLLPLQDLVIFASREPTVLESVVVIQPSDEDVHPAIRRGNPQLNWDEQHVEVITQLPGLLRQPRSDYERPLVPFAALKEEATEFISRWWSLHQKLGKDAMTALMSPFATRLFLHDRLLNEMSFTESYHRILHDEPAIPAEEHDQYVEKMLATIDNTKHRKHYAQRLKYAAALGQRQRLKRMIKRAKEVLPELGGLRPKLADQLVDTRNALTHLDPDGPEALTDERLYRAVELLEVVIQVNLLLDSGLSAAMTASLIKISYLNQTPFISFPS